MPAYSGTAVRLDTPGTTSKSMPPRTHAAASSATALSRNGSPLTSRTTRVPVEACLSTILARAEGLNGLASFGQAERDHLGIFGQRDGRMSQNLSLPIIVQDHRTGIGQSRNGAQRQQIRVTRSGADKDHATFGDRCGWSG